MCVWVRGVCAVLTYMVCLHVCLCKLLMWTYMCVSLLWMGTHEHTCVYIHVHKHTRVGVSRVFTCAH